MSRTEEEDEITLFNGYSSWALGFSGAWNRDRSDESCGPAAVAEQGEVVAVGTDRIAGGVGCSADSDLCFDCALAMGGGGVERISQCLPPS